MGRGGERRGSKGRGGESRGSKGKGALAVISYIQHSLFSFYLFSSFLGKVCNYIYLCVVFIICFFSRCKVLRLTILPSRLMMEGRKGGVREGRREGRGEGNDFVYPS